MFRCKLQIFTIFLVFSEAWAVHPQINTPAERLLFQAMPSSVEPVVHALGPRVRIPGKEQVVFVGQFVTATGNRPVLVVYQLPGLLRLEGFKNQAAVTFDGRNIHGQITRTDEILLETFILDMAEGMLSSIQAGGAAVRLLGRNFGPNPRSTRNYSGPRYDIFDVTAPVRFRTDRLIRTKRYLFDSKTGLLLMTQYWDRTVSPVAKVETRFSDWIAQEGSAYPGRMDRYENGQPIFSLIIQTVSAGPRQEIAAFR